MKKFFTSVFILLLFAAAVFFIGWVQLRVPAGLYGVFISKTGGVHSQLIQSGTFRWQWEALLPTNAQIRIFSAAPAQFNRTLTGSLPSAQLYSSMIEGRPDFSYDVTINMELAIKPSKLIELVKKYDIKDQGDIETFMAKEVNSIAQETIQLAFLSENASNNSQYLVKQLSDSNRWPMLEIASVSITVNKMPDMQVYTLAKQAYSTYQAQTQDNLIKLTEKQALSSANEYLQIERFSRWGKILSEYPILIEFLAVSRDDADKALSALIALRSKEKQ